MTNLLLAETCEAISLAWTELALAIRAIDPDRINRARKNIDCLEAAKAHVLGSFDTSCRDIEPLDLSGLTWPELTEEDLEQAMRIHDSLLQRD